MRNILLASTAAVCLVLTIPAANAQSDVKKHEETKKEQVKQPSAAEHRQQAQEHQPSRSTTGQASEEKKDAGKHESTKSEPRKEDANKGAASEKKGQTGAAKSSNEKDRHAQSEDSRREKTKSVTEQEKKSSGKKSTASEQNKTDQSTKPSTAEAPKASTPKQENASAPSSNTNAKAAPAENAATKTDATKNAAGSTPNVTNKTNTADSKAGQIDPQKKVQISETISRTRDLAPPVRNLNISISVGERVPSHIHLRPLPREIVTIAPEYRDYEYFTTEEDVVIVSPRTHEIVTEIPRDASRARAEFSSSSTSSTTSSNSSGALPCQVEQRTASGEMHLVDPSKLRETTGSAAGKEHLAVRVQGPNGQEMPEVTLPDSQGRIIAETNGSDCRIIIEPGQTNH